MTSLNLLKTVYWIQNNPVKVHLQYSLIGFTSTSSIVCNEFSLLQHRKQCTWIGYFSLCCDQMFDKQLKGWCGLMMWQLSITVVKAWWQEGEAVGQMASTFRKQRDMELVYCSLSFAVQDSSRTRLLTFSFYLSSQNLLKIFL